jgi:CHASE2 domain-containing sensor protein
LQKEENLYFSTRQWPNLKTVFLFVFLQIFCILVSRAMRLIGMNWLPLFPGAAISPEPAFAV